MLSLDNYNATTSICKPCTDNKGNLKPFNDDQCPVCLEVDTDTMLFPCSHQFHSDCILQWVKHNFTCPMCRTEIGQFIPLEGQELKTEFVELWNEHYFGLKPKAQDDPSDDTKKVSSSVEACFFKIFCSNEVLVEEKTENTTASILTEEIIIPLDEFELVFDDNTSTTAESTKEEQPEHLKELVPSEVVTEDNVEPFEFIPQTAFFVHRKLIPEQILLTKQLIGLAPFQQPWLTLGAVHSLFRRNKKQDTEPEAFQKRPHQYRTIDNLRGGAGSGVLTTAMKMIMERHSMRNLFPVFREVTPNVAIYFTVYEETKRLLGRKSDNYSDIFHQCFLSGCLGGFCAYLPRTHFTALVPLQFGLHFSTFEVAKQMITDYTGRTRLNVVDVGSTAILGGFVGSCVTYPLSKMFANAGLILQGNAQVAFTQNLTHQFWNHVFRMSPLWATTACGFEFSRRFITNT